jgi:mannosyl-3-phosphoglycerate phosphatase
LLRQNWLPEVHALRDKTDYNFEGFADWTDARVSELTGLSEQEAGLARQRQYSEPILWRGPASARRQFETDLAGMGLSLLEGGRFFSIQGQHDKSDAMQWMQQQFADSNTVTVALGDSPNDSAMLAAADIAVIIKSAKSEQIQIQGPEKIIRTSRPGPAGWKDAMMDILQLVDSTGENKHG